jgi:hypothetical protein
MKEAIIKISLLVLVFGISLIWAGTCFNDNAFFQNRLILCSECSDSGDPCDNFHLIFCEDDVFMCDSAGKSNVFNVGDDIITVQEVNILYDYFKNVWKPPELS